MGRIIEAKTFHARKTVVFARWLLGKFLVRRLPDGREEARMILETEAYCGESDLACHARAGRTKRTEVLYGEGGVWYVYLCYGIHEMLNLVVGPRDWPEAILIRGVEGAIGPGRVTKTLAIDRRLNATTAEPSSGLWLEDRNVRLPRTMIKVTPRIGIDYSGPIWSAKHWRFTVDPRALPSGRAALRKAESNSSRSHASKSAPAAPAAPTSPDR